MTTTRRRPRHGDECWEVEWCTRVATYDGTDDVDTDRCEYSFERFPTRAAAVAFAVKTWPTTTGKLGHVCLRLMRWVTPEGDPDWLGGWEPTGTYEHVSDDSGETEEDGRRRRLAATGT